MSGGKAQSQASFDMLQGLAVGQIYICLICNSIFFDIFVALPAVNPSIWEANGNWINLEVGANLAMIGVCIYPCTNPSGLQSPVGFASLG